MKKGFVFLCCIIASHFLSASPLVNSADSVLHLHEIIEAVRLHHPVIKQTQINIQKAMALQTQSRAAFDPTFTNYIGRKTFGGTNYYQMVSPEIKLPTWYGVTVSGGVEDITGQRLDPSSTFGQHNYIGVDFSLVKNLLIDKRRAVLQQAKITQGLTESEQAVLVNDLMMQVVEDYLDWVKNYQIYLIYKENTRVAEERFNMIKKGYQNGERAAIDTLEAYAQAQAFLLQQYEYQLLYNNASLQLSLYFWTDDGKTVEIPNGVNPPQNWDEDKLTESISLDNLMNQLAQNHPVLSAYSAKLGWLTVDKKLKFQELLPVVDIGYRMLGKGYNPTNSFQSSSLLLENNFNYGVKMSIPLRLSEGRAVYKMAQLKIAETEWERDYKNQMLQNKLKQYYNEYLLLKKQVKLQAGNYANLTALVTGENKRVENGESSLFLVNARQNKALEAYEKWMTLRTKYVKSQFAILWSIGSLK